MWKSAPAERSCWRRSFCLLAVVFVVAGMHVFEIDEQGEMRTADEEFDAAFVMPREARGEDVIGTPDPPAEESAERNAVGANAQLIQMASTQETDGGDTSKRKKHDGGNPKNGLRLHEAIDVCSAAYDEHGAYPSIYRQIFLARQTRWRGHHNPTDVAINNKLGAYYFAAKHSVASPRILYCGEAGGLPEDMASFGRAYVVKPLEGYSARGVHVVKDGVNILKGKNVTRSSLLSKWNETLPVLVEQLIEDPEFPGRVPPDYKFFVFNGRVELAGFYDRNPGAECKDFLDVTSSEWRRMDAFQHSSLRPCNRTSYLDGPSGRAMLDAAEALASNAGGNWMRVDMFRSPAGPVLGEFTPFSSAGRSVGMDACVMSYLFVKHAVAAGRNDDAATLSRIVNERTIRLDATVPEQKKPELEEVVRGWIPKDFAVDMVDHMNVDYSMMGWDQQERLEQCNRSKEMQDRMFGKNAPETLGESQAHSSVFALHP